MPSGPQKLEHSIITEVCCLCQPHSWMVSCPTVHSDDNCFIRKSVCLCRHSLVPRPGNLNESKLLTSAALGLAVPIRFQNASRDSCRISIASHSISKYNTVLSRGMLALGTMVLFELLLLTCLQLL